MAQHYGALGWGEEGGQLVEAGGPERQFVEATRRMLRAPEGRLALVLRLSCLTPPAPGPHHRRVARALLDDVADRHEGQVFALGNGDMVLLCRASGGRPGTVPPLATPETLPETLQRLWRTDSPDPAQLTTVWPLDEEPRGLIAYAAERLTACAAASPAAADPNPPVPVVVNQTGAVAAIVASAELAPLAETLSRHTAVLFAASDPLGPFTALRPLFHEVGFSIAALEARLGADGQAAADPFLLRYLAGRLDARLLVLLGEATGGGGPLDITGADVAVHLNLSVPAILSEAFGRLTVAAAEAGTRLGVEVTPIEASADATAFAQARRLLVRLGIALVLDEVPHPALSLAALGAWRPDLVKIAWTPRLAGLPADESQAVAVALEEIGPERVVLQHAGSEAALLWGLARGIRRFQGRHVDAMLAVSRMLACPHAAGCSLGSCMAAGRAAVAAGRRKCRLPELIDRGAPVPAGATEGPP